MIAGYLSTTEIEKCVDKIVLIPFGSFEQHGPHLPLLTDSVIAEEIAKRVEFVMPNNVLLFPTIWFGDSIEHQGFAGTLSVSAMHLMRVLNDLLAWLNRSGFKKGILFHGHGGNINLGATICEEFSREHTFKVRNFSAYTDSIKQLSKELFGVTETHAGSTESSLIAHLRPELIMNGAAELANTAPYAGGGRLAYMNTKDLSPSGILHAGDTIEIDAQKGEQLAAEMVNSLSNAITKLQRLELE